MRKWFAGRKAILFDIDGTLVDSNRSHVHAWEEAFRDAGRAVSATAIWSQIGKGGDQLVPALLPGIAESDASRISAQHDEIFRTRYLPRVKPFDDASELIRALDEEGLMILLASSAKRAEVDHYVALLGVELTVRATTSADDVERSKPAGDIFSAALSKIAPVTAAESLVVGDTPYDVEAARQCGIDTIAVQSGGFSRETLTGAIAVYPSVADLLAILEASAPARRRD